MIIDGRKLASVLLDEIATVVKAMPKPPTLTVFTCEPNFETEKFLRLKQKQANLVGIMVQVVALPKAVTLAEVSQAIAVAANNTDAIIIQFPFPHLATADLMSLVPPSHDVDVMNYQGWLSLPLPPVVGAIDVIAKQAGIEFANKQVVVVGKGPLVGAPASLYAQARGGMVTVVTKDSNSLDQVATADIIITGAGVPNLIQADMVPAGVVVFDAGTSEEAGVLVGDVAKEVADKASLFTPVPGGIGPLTVAILLKNVLYFAQKRGK